MTESDEIWISRLQKCLDATRAWEERVGYPDKVDPQSSLGKDDDGLSGDPVRSAAWYGLVTAVDHLGLLADLAKTELTIRPSAIFTPARAALLGASQSVWVLTGRRADRIGKGLYVAEDERRQHRAFIRGYKHDKYVHEQFSEAFRNELDRIDGELSEEISRLAALRKSRPYDGKVTDTLMMGEAAGHLAKSGKVVDEWLRLALAYEWRMSSAAAHARSWPMHVRKTESLPLLGGHEEIRRMTSSIEEVVKSVSAATLMASEAWRLWDLRRQVHI